MVPAKIFFSLLRFRYPSRRENGSQMKNVSIIGKFLVLLAAFGLFALGLAFYAGDQITKVDRGYAGLLTAEEDASMSLARASRTFQTVRAAISDILLTTNKEQEKKAFDEIALARAEFNTFVDRAAADLPQDASIKDLKAQAATVLDQSCAKSITLGSKALTYLDIKSAMEVFFTECQPLFVTTTQAFSAKVEDLAKVSGVRKDELSATSAAIYWTTIGGVIGGLVIITIVSFLMIKVWLVKPVQSLSAVMEQLAEGDLDAEISGVERKDEVGGMARAVQVFKDNGLRARHLEQEADAQRSQSEEQRRTAAERDRARADAMAQATSGLADGLKHLAAGDLTFQLAQPFAEDFEALRTDFNRAIEQLRGTLNTVADAGASIDSGAREVSHSADDLSKRTEQQAASLEETAAALDEITANVSNSSKRAEEARNVAIQANQSAHLSGTVVANAVEAMGRIEQSSSQISNIIGVIDDIAFQTNLLALNAGVEAARAGEAGKGFAVVAQEVRELAQRSAKAAKEIKDLIRNSSVEVDSGVKLVSETGEALKTIEAYIVTINQHMDAIATSAREQSVGLSEVNTAVNQMDQVTQQNAAMVEEANAAGATLAHEAARLRTLIAGFQLGQAGTSGATASGGSFARPQATASAGRSMGSAAPRAAAAHSAPVASPARKMVGKIAQAFTGRSSAAAAPAADNWEEF
jgi:methyl-accepting chemotaxis protein